MNLKDRVRSLCKLKDVTAQQVEIDLSLGKGYISKLDKSKPTSSRLQKIADYFGVSYEYLLDGEKEEPAADKSSRLHVETAYDLLSPENQEKIRMSIVALLKQQSDSE